VAFRLKTREYFASSGFCYKYTVAYTERKETEGEKGLTNRVKLSLFWIEYGVCTRESLKIVFRDSRNFHDYLLNKFSNNFPGLDELFQSKFYANY